MGSRGAASSGSARSLALLPKPPGALAVCAAPLRTAPQGYLAAEAQPAGLSGAGHHRQGQEHVSETYHRFRDVANWIWALKGDWSSTFRRSITAGEAEDAAAGGEASNPQEAPLQQFSAEGEKQQALQLVRRRVRVLLVLMGLFLWLVFKDARRRWRETEVESIWLKACEGLNVVPPPPPPPLEKPGAADPAATGGMSGMGGYMGGYGGYGGMGGMGRLGGYY
ncbi:unnamed protein product [Prorocentrum cordatum]|uniref:Peroxin-13 n=1 Tax=Prorocentrum cordatum TaxID=2364126 RepID=A0ABN9VAB1_9DINO|nr:unnamed protein product [Polarella glacialis]